MSNYLPQQIHPWSLYRYRETLSGLLDLSMMTGLCELQKRYTGDVVVDIAVVEREDGKTVLRGKASAELELECQRCLAPLEKVFSPEFEFVLVKHEGQLASVDEQDDAIVVEDELTLIPLIEQELILSLPMIAKHDNCTLNYENTANETDERQQPFANLKDLLN